MNKVLIVYIRVIKLGMFTLESKGPYNKKFKLRYTPKGTRFSISSLRL